MDKQLKPIITATRSGDVYEFMGLDAVVTARILKLPLTDSGRGLLAQLPWNGVEKFIPALQESGYRLALVEGTN